MKAPKPLVSAVFLTVALIAGRLDANAGEILLAHEGITSWTTRPHAVYHNGRTYFGYQSQRNVEVNDFDHASGAIGTPVVVHTYARDDDHGTPSLFVVPAGEHAGKLVVLYAHHNDPLYSRRSANAEDISAWDAPATIDNAGCNYPKPFVRSDGSVWMSYRLSGVGHVYRTTTDGTTWSEPTTLISGGLAYVFLATRGDTFHLGLGLYVGGTKRFRDAYHAYSDDGGMTWKQSDGTPIALPITAANATCAYDDSAGSEWSRVLDIAIDADGTPAMLFYYNMPNFRSGSMEFLNMTVAQLRWDGSKWQLEDVLTPAPYHRANLGAGAVYACSGAQKPGDIDTVVVMEGQHGVYSGNDFRTIEVPCRARAVLYRRSPDGWRRVGPVTSAPETRPDLAGSEVFETRPQWIQNAQGDFQLILSRVTHYRAYQDWTSSLIGVTMTE
ncbi:MAG: BNR-4 repeat-containing protein [Thermoguttaceae bacterium]|jgi:hypothetical protein|nr:BNR-4 repeat-containing protein [Thermoguttaceae bacterium]